MDAFRRLGSAVGVRRGDRKAWVVAGVAALAMVAAGCGSGAEGSGGGEGGAATDADVQAARDYVAPVLERPTEILLTTPIEGEVPSGKTIAYLRCGSPACAGLAKPFEAGAEVMGWDVDIIDAGFTPESAQAAWNQVLRSEPDGVFYMGLPRAFFDQQLRAVAAKDIPVVAFAVTDPPTDGLTATLLDGPPTEEWGRLKANWIIADAEGEANVVQFVATDFEVQVAEAKVFKTEYEANCPGCAHDEVSVKAGDIGTKIPAQVTNYLRANPEVNYVSMGFDDLATGVPAALAAAGLSDRVKIIGQTPSAESVSYLNRGEIDATLNNPGHEIMWRAIDILARTYLDEPLPDEAGEFTNWLVTEETADDLPTAPHPNVADYESQYRKLWDK